MNEFTRTHAGAMDMSVDADLRAFMLGVYNKMALGLLISAGIAYAVGTVAPLTALVFGTPLLYLVQFGPLVLIIGSMMFMRRPSPIGSAILYWSVVALIGAGLSIWVLIAQSATGVETLTGTISVTFGTIAQAFVITAASFLGLSLYGYTTKTNLQSLGGFLIMAVIGVVVIVLLNIFFIESSGLQLIMQFAILLLMAGVTAWQTQNLKITYGEIRGDQRSMAVMTNMGALNLYIAFVNIFKVLMMFLGNRD